MRSVFFKMFFLSLGLSQAWGGGNQGGPEDSSPDQTVPVPTKRLLHFRPETRQKIWELWQEQRDRREVCRLLWEGQHLNEEERAFFGSDLREGDYCHTASTYYKRINRIIDSTPSGGYVEKKERKAPFIFRPETTQKIWELQQTKGTRAICNELWPELLDEERAVFENNIDAKHYYNRVNTEIALNKRDSGPLRQKASSSKRVKISPPEETGALEDLGFPGKWTAAAMVVFEGGDVGTSYEGFLPEIEEEREYRITGPFLGDVVSPLAPELALEVRPNMELEPNFESPYSFEAAVLMGRWTNLSPPSDESTTPLPSAELTPELDVPVMEGIESLLAKVEEGERHPRPRIRLGKPPVLKWTPSMIQVLEDHRKKTPQQIAPYLWDALPESMKPYFSRKNDPVLVERLTSRRSQFKQTVRCPQIKWTPELDQMIEKHRAKTPKKALPFLWDALPENLKAHFERKNDSQLLKRLKSRRDQLKKAANT